tara:strand:- start:243 stop:413 length:171 start_codon:yes stop_codon:yes gene_type:complete
MHFKITTIIYLVISVAVAILYINNSRPVHWVDSLVGFALGGLVFYLLKKFKGIIWK